MSSGASQSTILVHLVAPLDEQHALDHIQAIRSHGTSAPSPSSSDSDTADDLEWDIKNKYYSATVLFKIIQDLAPTSDEPAIIVLAPRSPTPPASLSSLLSLHSSRTTEYEISLLVAYPLSPSSASSPQDLDAWDDLAISHGFEYVDLAVADGGARIEDEGEDRVGEQSGVARVVAALQAHLWEGLETPISPLYRHPDLAFPDQVLHLAHSSSSNLHAISDRLAALLDSHERHLWLLEATRVDLDAGRQDLLEVVTLINQVAQDATDERIARLEEDIERKLLVLQVRGDFPSLSRFIS
ncbi:hypothetical protein RQP46_011381 [Phenoliferia psychrophenolica]